MLAVHNILFVNYNFDGIALRARIFVRIILLEFIMKVMKKENIWFYNVWLYYTKDCAEIKIYMLFFANLLM